MPPTAKAGKSLEGIPTRLHHHHHRLGSLQIMFCVLLEWGRRLAHVLTFSLDRRL
jgi:hypothetical protein